jgi:cell division protein FtsB
MEINQLQEENARVRDHITSLNTDKDAIEREAREKLHYARSGEIIYAVPEQPANAPAKQNQITK